MSVKGKPDPLTRRSSAPVWIIVVDKSEIVEPGVIDVFYFCETLHPFPLCLHPDTPLCVIDFYPYNLGNIVVFNTFGNHVGEPSRPTALWRVRRLMTHGIGDWEHSMVRFKDGEPIAVHLSAHADGHSWAWKTMEKMENRPVGYVASGSRKFFCNCSKPTHAIIQPNGSLSLSLHDVRIRH